MRVARSSPSMRRSWNAARCTWRPIRMGGIPVDAGDRVLEGEFVGVQAAAPVAVKPLVLVEHEADGPDQREVVGGEGVQRGDVGVDLGTGDRLVEVGEILEV